MVRGTRAGGAKARRGDGAKSRPRGSAHTAASDAATALKSYRAIAEHLAAIAWAYTGRPLSALPDVAREVIASAETAPAIVRNRLACLKAAGRWAWKKRGLVDADPTARMQLPVVKNERQVYVQRRAMLTACRACTN